VLFTASVESDSDSVLADELRSIGYTVISIDKETQFKAKCLNFWYKLKGIPAQEIVFFSRQLSSLLKAGIPVAEALSSIAEQTKNKVFIKAIEAILEDIRSGIYLSDALVKHPHIFSELFVSMVKVGETTGNLDDILDRLAQVGAEEIDIKARIKSAFTYPVILVIAAVVIVTFLLVNVIPKFVIIFENYEAALPLSTKVLLGLSVMARKLWLISVLAAGGIAIWFRKYLKTEKGRYKFDFFLLKLPFFGQLYLKIVVSRFSRTLGLLVKSGIPMLEALYVTEKTVKNSVVSHVIDNIRVAITEGQSLSEPLLGACFRR